MQVNKKQIEFLIKLKKKKYRDEHQKFLFENPKVIWEEFSNPLLDSVYVTDNFYKDNEDRMVFKTIYRLSEKDLKKISNQVNPLGMLALFDMPHPKKFIFKSKHVLILDNIADPGNMGTIIRTADWFGFNHVFLGTGCVEIYNPKVVAASMGSIFNISINEEVDLKNFIKDLKNEAYQIIVTDLMGDEFSINKKNNIALIIGNEAKGVDKKLIAMADQRFKIMKSGKAESLNAAVAAGIVMNKIKF
ncbi:MAG: RNA methyltransferase [Patescibacteria group bacterium]|jgi:TrmH family RNA methyltransferase